MADSLTQRLIRSISVQIANSTRGSAAYVARDYFVYPPIASRDYTSPPFFPTRPESDSRARSFIHRERFDLFMGVWPHTIS